MQPLHGACTPGSERIAQSVSLCAMGCREAMMPLQHCPRNGLPCNIVYMDHLVEVGGPLRSRLGH